MHTWKCCFYKLLEKVEKFNNRRLIHPAKVWDFLILLTIQLVQVQIFGVPGERVSNPPLILQLVMPSLPLMITHFIEIYLIFVKLYIKLYLQFCVTINSIILLDFAICFHIILLAGIRINSMEDKMMCYQFPRFFPYNCIIFCLYSYCIHFFLIFWPRGVKILTVLSYLIFFRRKKRVWYKMNIKYRKKCVEKIWIMIRKRILGFSSWTYILHFTLCT